MRNGIESCLFSFFCKVLYLYSSLCLSCTIIYSSVFILHIIHLQIHLFLAVVIGDGEASLNRLRVIFRNTARDVCQPLQTSSCSLSDPSQVLVTTKSRDCTGKSVRSYRFNDHWFRLSQCLTPTDWKTNSATLTFTTVHMNKSDYQQVFKSPSYILWEQTWR